MRTIDGVDAAVLFSGGTLTTLDGIPVRVISLEHLIANKKAAGRKQDLLDVEFLEKTKAFTAG